MRNHKTESYDVQLRNAKDPVFLISSAVIDRRYSVDTVRRCRKIDNCCSRGPCGAVTRLAETWLQYSQLAGECGGDEGGVVAFPAQSRLETKTAARGHARRRS